MRHMCSIAVGSAPSFSHTLPAYFLPPLPAPNNPHCPFSSHFLVVAAVASFCVEAVAALTMPKLMGTGE